MPSKPPLLPCPFCGARPVLQKLCHDENGKPEVFYYISCFNNTRKGDHSCAAIQVGDSRKEVTAAWNRRSAPLMKVNPDGSTQIVA